MTEIRTEKEIEYIAAAGKIVSGCHREIRKMIIPGISTMEINKFADKYIRQNGGIPAQIGYMGYPYATCASVNDEICHAFPDGKRLKDGDIVKIDMVVELNGWMADSAWAYKVGNVSAEADKLLKVTKECLYIGIDKAIVGNRVGDISNAIQIHAESNGFSVVKDYTGHGIGKEMHDGLVIPHYGPAGKGPRLLEGMVLTIEPMINTGVYKCKIDNDGWTARTVDGSLSAQYEHTIAITGKGPIILTEQEF